MRESGDVVLFDFFGTLTQPLPKISVEKLPLTCAVAAEVWPDVSASRLVEVWRRTKADLERQGDESQVEYPMSHLINSIAENLAVRSPNENDSRRLVNEYIKEWVTLVDPVEGVAEMLDRLMSTYNVGVVSNANDNRLVEAVCANHGLTSILPCLTTSIDVGYRKPSPRIFESALALVGGGVERSVFVGDNYLPDFVGPTQVGMSAVLIDPDGSSDAPAGHQIRDVLQTEFWLAM